MFIFSKKLYYFSHANPKCIYAEWFILGVTPPFSIFKYLYSCQSQSYLLCNSQAMPRNETLYAKVGIHSWQILVIRLSEMARMSTDLTPANFNVF